MTDTWNTQETTTLSWATPHSHVCTLYMCVQFILPVGPGNLGFGSLCQSHQPGRVVTAFGSELFQVTVSSWKNDTAAQVELQSPELRITLMVWRKLALFCILPCKMFPLAFHGDLHQGKSNWVLFLQLLAYRNNQGNALDWMGRYHSFSIWAIPSLWESGRTKGKRAIQWMNTLETHRNIHTSALLLTVTCNTSILCNIMPHL